MPKPTPDTAAQRYQRDRYARLIAEGTCPQCAKRRVVAGKSRCPDCARKSAQVNRRAQQGRKARGVCVHCGNPKGRDGTKIRCRRCADALGAARRRLTSERRAAGLCFDCGKPAGKGRNGPGCRCSACARRAADWAQVALALERLGWGSAPI